MQKIISTSGFVGVIGRPNAGKSTLLNALIKSPLALVSKKANATRKRMDFILPHKLHLDKINFNLKDAFLKKANLKEDKSLVLDSQIIFIDTPGIDGHVLKNTPSNINSIDEIEDLSNLEALKSSKLLNQFLFLETIKGISSSDLCIFISPVSEDEKILQKEISQYEEFLSHYKKPHILVLNKTDLLSKDSLLACIKKYSAYEDKYLGLIPLSATNLSKDKSFAENKLLDLLALNLPLHPHFYDNEILTTSNFKELYKEAIREAIFERLSEEIPYESDVRILKIIESNSLDKIYADIIVEKSSQKAIMIGKKGETIKALGILSRKKCEILSGKKIFLDLKVLSIKGWSKEKQKLKQIGYDFN